MVDIGQQMKPASWSAFGTLTSIRTYMV